MDSRATESFYLGPARNHSGESKRVLVRREMVIIARNAKSSVYNRVTLTQMAGGILVRVLLTLRLHLTALCMASIICSKTVLVSEEDLLDNALHVVKNILKQALQVCVERPSRGQPEIYKISRCLRRRRKTLTGHHFVRYSSTLEG